MPYMHYFVVDDDKLISPCEDLNENHCGEFWLPLQSAGEFHDEYQVDILKDFGDGKTHEYSPRSCTFNHENKELILVIHDFQVLFKVTPESRRLKYGGNLGHPDFQSDFVEVFTEDLDDLLEKKKIGVFGCNPWNNYLMPKLRSSAAPLSLCDNGA